MRDHGELDDIETNSAIGELVNRMVEQLRFAPGALAKTSFEIDGVQYEVTLRMTK